MSLIGEAFQQLLGALDKLEIRYAAGGSVATSIRGNYRQTNDVDILVQMQPDQAREFIELLGPAFHANSESLIAAFQLGRPYNIIHMRSAFKFDLFPVAASSFEATELDRRTFEIVDFFGEEIELAVVTSEDALLAKLRWYRLGGESSEQQWRDITGVVAIQGSRLNQEYLMQWAKWLAVEDLLKRALE